jgi:hypothetical protein
MNNLTNFYFLSFIVYLLFYISLSISLKCLGFNGYLCALDWLVEQYFDIFYSMKRIWLVTDSIKQNILDNLPAIDFISQNYIALCFVRDLLSSLSFLKSYSVCTQVVDRRCPLHGCCQVIWRNAWSWIIVGNVFGECHTLYTFWLPLKNYGELRRDEQFSLQLRLQCAYLFRNLQKRSLTCRECDLLQTRYPQ